MDRIFTGDALTILKTLRAGSVQTCVTSPPYFGLRDYGVQGQIGVERTPDEFIRKMVDIFREVHRVLRDDGTLWLNLGDSYSGSGKGAYGDGIVRLSDKSNKQQTSNGTHQGVFKKPESGLDPKNLIGIPWRVAFALQADGWYLRQDIIWHKSNPMPESIKDRCTKAHEYIFLLSKSPKYYFNADAIKEPVSGGTHLTLSKKKAEEIRAARAGGANTSYGSGFKSPKTHKVDGMVKQNESFHNAVCLPVEKRNRRSVWTVSTKPYKGAHFATFPPDLIEPCILAGASIGGVVLDPFLGSGTTAAVAQSLGRMYVGIELNPKYVGLALQRIAAIKSANYPPIPVAVLGQ